MKKSTLQLFLSISLKVQVLLRSLKGPDIASELISLFVIALILLTYFSSKALYPIDNSALKFVLLIFYIILEDVHHGKKRG